MIVYLPIDFFLFVFLDVFDIKISFCSNKLPDSLSIWLLITASKHWERPCKSKPVNDMGGKYKSKGLYIYINVQCIYVLFLILCTI